MDLKKVKICLLGECAVGKSSVAYRFVKDSFNPLMDTTIGASLLTKSFEYDGKMNKLEIWDTAGQERFRALSPMYYRGSAAAILVFDITKEHSFKAVHAWVEELKKRAPQDIVIAVVGNKTDLESMRVVQSEEAQDYADSHGAIYVETSAKTAKNVSVIFEEIVKHLPVHVNNGDAEVGVNLQRDEVKSVIAATEKCAC